MSGPSLVDMSADAPDVLRVGNQGSAVFSADGKRRRYLTRQLSGSTKRVGFLMLNPSDATADDDDPTIQRCVGFGRREDAGSIEVANLFDYIETDSRRLGELMRQGVLTDVRSADYVKRLLTCDLVICAWGATPYARGKLSLFMSQHFGARDIRVFGFKCLGRTKTGAPRHPLYLASSTKLENWP